MDSQNCSFLLRANKKHIQCSIDLTKSGYLNFQFISTMVNRHSFNSKFFWGFHLEIFFPQAKDLIRYSAFFFFPSAQFLILYPYFRSIDFFSWNYNEVEKLNLYVIFPNTSLFQAEKVNLHFNQGKKTHKKLMHEFIMPALTLPTWRLPACLVLPSSILNLISSRF